MKRWQCEAVRKAERGRGGKHLNRQRRLSLVQLDPGQQEQQIGHRSSEPVLARGVQGLLDQAIGVCQLASLGGNDGQSPQAARSDPVVGDLTCSEQSIP